MLSQLNELPTLKAGDTVEIIAPAARCSRELLTSIKDLVSSWQLNCIIDEHIFGDDLLCANQDAMRFQMLKDALLNPASHAVICARGGYGSMRLIPALSQVTPPPAPKLFIGMSDITALHLFLMQKWHWPVVHGALATDKFSPESIAAVKALLFAEEKQHIFHGVPLNAAAEENRLLQSSLTGGNLCLAQTSIGTDWQIQARGRLILLEEIGERGYRVDRMLQHLHQAGVLQEAAGIVFGDFFGGEEPDGSTIISPVLTQFAQSLSIPVVKIKGVGHGYVNFPLPLGRPATLKLGQQIELVCSR